MLYYAWAPKSLELSFLFLFCPQDSLCVFKSVLCEFKILQKQHHHQSFVPWIIQRRDGSYWLIPSLDHFVLGPVISWRSQVLLYAHSKCIRSCCMCIQNIAGAALFISQRQVENWIQELVLIISVHRWRKPALPAFMIKIQYGSSHNTMDVQRAISQRIQN